MTYSGLIVDWALIARICERSYCDKEIRMTFQETLRYEVGALTARVQASMRPLLNDAMRRDLPFVWRTLCPDTFLPKTKKELRALCVHNHDVLVARALEAYIEWAVLKVARSGRFAPRPMPLPRAADKRRMAARTGCPVALLETVIGFLPLMDCLPLLGAIDDKTDTIHPDEESIRAWQREYDPRSGRMLGLLPR
ncbi:MAG: hypothetical protein RLZZ324_1185 [Candidatus Parcubacteria bacterium]|jgi:hypothetical protein